MVMASVQFKIGLLQFAVLCLLLQGNDAQRITPNKEELIQDTVRKFLNVKSDERTALLGKIQSFPPQYMMYLYEKYRSGQIPMQGNTVRSILAMRVKVDKVDMLVFNLTGLKSTEQILQSKLYLLKRRKPKGGKERIQATFRLNMGCLPDMPSKHQIDISLARHEPEWHSYDISEAMVSCRQIRKGNDSLLGLTLDIKRPKGSYRSTEFKRLLKPNSQPFILIFSEDSHNQSTSTLTRETTQDAYGEIGDLLRAKANEEDFLPENFGPPLNSNTTHRHRGKRDNRNLMISKYFNDELSKVKHDFQPDYLTNSNKYSQKLLNAVSENFDFKKNSHCDFMRLLPLIIDNIRNSLNVNRKMYDEHPDEFTSANAMHPVKDAEHEIRHHFNLTNDAMIKVLFSKRMLTFHDKNINELNKVETLSSDKRSKRSISNSLHYSTQVKESNNTEPTVQVFDENYIKNQSAEALSKPRGRKDRKELKERRQNHKLPFSWKRPKPQVNAQDIKQMCKKKSLMVEFSQLGWDEFIMYPKSFDAYYCEGSCTLSTIKHTDASNHAVLQSLIHEMGLNMSIPIPSCVPSLTAPLSVLYLEENGNIVLKKYRDMVVLECGCR